VLESKDCTALEEVRGGGYFIWSAIQRVNTVSLCVKACNIMGIWLYNRLTLHTLEFLGDGILTGIAMNARSVKVTRKARRCVLAINHHFSL
jgi:hypothetical protein